MASSVLKSVEQRVFRALNSVVEPAVRKGLVSTRCFPSTLIVLETIGFKSGETKCTPLLATRIGAYVFVSTFRGDRSFWVRNLIKEPNVSYYLAGQQLDAQAYVVAPDNDLPAMHGLPAFVSVFLAAMKVHTDKGWAFAVLAPVVV